MTNEQYVKAVSDPVTRTGISWMLMGDAYRLALRDLYVILLQDPDLLLKLHARHARGSDNDRTFNQSHRR